MTAEVAEQAPVQTAEQIEADAAFSAGFDEAPVVDTVPETNPAENATTEQPKKEAKPEAAPAAVPVLINGVPEAEWNAAVAKAAGPMVEQARAEIRKNFGQIGEINRTLTELKSSIAAGNQSAASRKKLTAEALKRVNEELPGLGDALAQDLAEFLDGPDVAAQAAAAQAKAESKGQTFDSEAFFTSKIGPALESLEARANERAELRIVKSMHRDFDRVVASAEFGAWLVTLPTEEQTRIRESEDGFVAADAVTEFKAHREKQVKGKTNKQNRLEGALTPSGDKTPSSHVDNDEDAAFEKGFKSVK